MADVRGDRRVRRTRARLGQALIELVGEQGYDRTTVQDVIDRADVGRSTFYAHYRDKDDLLVSGLEHLTEDIERHLADDPVDADTLLPSLGVFRHVGEQHQLFRALIGSRGVDLVTEAAQQVLEDWAREAIARREEAGQRQEVPTDVRAAFLAGSLMSLLAWWIDHDMPHPPERMAAMYRAMTAAA